MAIRGEYSQPQVPYPIGTVEELRKNPFWKPSQWYTCAPHDPAVGIRGCPNWDDCPFNEGEVYERQLPQIKGVAGPQNFGVQQIRQSLNGLTKIVNTVLPCWSVERRARNMELAGGSLRIIGTEGEYIDVAGSRPEDLAVPGHPTIRTHNQQEVQMLVKPFPRPHENPMLTANAFAAKQAEKYRKDQAAKRTSAFMGGVTTHADAAPPKEKDSGSKPGTRG
jgi:hypothetical protein